MSVFDVSGLAKLEQWASQIRSVKDLAEDLADDAIDAFRDQIARTVTAGQTPDGDEWAPTIYAPKPLRNALAHVRFGSQTVRGTQARTVIWCEVGDHHYLHHAGIANGAPMRQIIPDRLTADMNDAIKDATLQACSKMMGGDRG